jgi:hypothetical protein
LVPFSELHRRLELVYLTDEIFFILTICSLLLFILIPVGISKRFDYYLKAKIIKKETIATYTCDQGISWELGERLEYVAPGGGWASGGSPSDTTVRIRKWPYLYLNKNGAEVGKSYFEYGFYGESSLPFGRLPEAIYMFTNKDGLPNSDRNHYITISVFTSNNFSNDDLVIARNCLKEKSKEVENAFSNFSSGFGKKDFNMKLGWISVMSEENARQNWADSTKNPAPLKFFCHKGKYGYLELGDQTGYAYLPKFGGTPFFLSVDGIFRSTFNPPKEITEEDSINMLNCKMDDGTTLDSYLKNLNNKIYFVLD